MAKCKYTVQYGPHTAKFSDIRDAHAFAIAKSEEGFGAEIHERTGIVGQYQNGETTHEFLEHYYAVFPNGYKPIGKREVA